MADTLPIARPTLNVAGRDQAELSDRLLFLRVEETIDGIHHCEATLANWGETGAGVGYLYFDGAVLDFGKAWQVKIGTDVVFSGRITGLEGVFPERRPPEIQVLAEDALQDLRMCRRTRTFESQSDRDVFGRIAQDHGLTADIALDGPTHAVLAQVNESDLAFLHRRARALEAELWVVEGKLHVARRADRRGTPLRRRFRGEIREFNALADLAHQRTAISVTGYDVAAKAPIRHEATDAVVSGELDGGESGAAVLRRAFGERKENLAHTAPRTAAEAQAEAEAHFRQRARRFVTGQAVSGPDAALRVGARVELADLGPWFSGTWSIIAVRHVFDGDQGLRTEFDVERAGLGGGDDAA